MLAEAAEQGAPLLLMLMVAGGAAAAATFAVGKFEARRGLAKNLAAPSRRTLAKALGVLLLASSLALVTTARALPKVHEGLVAKPSAAALVRVIQFVTDVDRAPETATATPQSSCWCFGG